MQWNLRGIRTLARPASPGDYLFANALSVALVYGLGAGSGFIFWVIAARLADEEVVGTASAAIAAAMLISSLGALGTHHAVARWLPTATDDALALLPRRSAPRVS